jgi:hypothetical protein
VLQSDLGRTEVHGRTHASTAMPGRAASSRVPIMNAGATGSDLFFHQGSAVYTWDGEVAYGMIERSLPAVDVAVAGPVAR